MLRCDFQLAWCLESYSLVWKEKPLVSFNSRWLQRSLGFYPRLWLCFTKGFSDSQDISWIPTRSGWCIDCIDRLHTQVIRFASSILILSIQNARTYNYNCMQFAMRSPSAPSFQAAMSRGLVPVHVPNLPTQRPAPGGWRRLQLWSFVQFRRTCGVMGTAGVKRLYIKA